jgi:hypothetical protein
VEVELLLVALEGGGRRGLGQDVALDEVVALGAVGEALLEVVCCALALELEGPGLEGAVAGVSLVMLGGGCGSRQVGGRGDGRVKTYGAVVVSIRMCLFLRSWASGRCCRCFSRLLRLSVLRTGERGATSTAVSSEAMVGGGSACVGSVEGWIVCKQSRGICGVIYSR